MTRPLHWIRTGTLAACLAMGVGCDAAKDKLKEAAGVKMEFSGTVLRAGTTEPVANANVALIPLASIETLKSLVEYKKIPDGKGGKKDQVRVKLDKVQAFADTNAEVVKTTTDATGKFKTEAPINVYLVYTSGPGAKPGTTAAAYGPHFWGIDPDTGELTVDSLIGKDLKPAQVNDKIQLSGGPVPPAATPAATPMPPAVVTPPAAPTTAPVEVVQPEPTPTDTTPLPPGNIVPPAAPATAFWKSVKLTFKDGFIGTGGPLETKTAPLVEPERFLELSAELAAPQDGPVYLVIQKGFDSTFVAGCEGTNSASTTRVYPVKTNGTTISYQLVPPGPFYKMFLAKTATQAKEGDAPTAVDQPSEVLTVGERVCASAVPERPFLATLSWDKEVDIDLHVTKYNAAQIAAATTGDMIGAAVVDKAAYTQRQGTTLSLDVDNTYAYGPENNGEASTVLDVDNFCYMVQVNYYSGSQPVNVKVDVTMVSTVGGKKNVKQIPNQVAMTTSGEWKTIGAFGPAGCAKLLNPPSTPENVITYPPLSSCTIADYCAVQGDQPGKFKATVTLEKASFASAEAIKVQYSNMPGLSGDWITIVPKAQTDKSWCSWQWSSGTEGTQWYGGLPPGEYEVRMYYGWSPGQCEVIGRQGFTVTP